MPLVVGEEDKELGLPGQVATDSIGLCTIAALEKVLPASLLVTSQAVVPTVYVLCNPGQNSEHCTLNASWDCTTR